MTNNLIPMQLPDGSRCFVNAWDVASRKADGWSVVGDLAFHTASPRAPVDLLDGGGKPPAKPIDPAAERARVKAIARAADDDQEALADELIAGGAPEAVALKALAADRAARKAKATKPGKVDEKPATPPAPTPPAPPA